jgi:hypothetical protein
LAVCPGFYHWFRSNKLVNGAVSCAILLALSFSHTPECPGTQIQPHSMPGGNVIHCLLAQLYCNSGDILAG